jgi:uncharacterized protein YunC (DUF1805 family)
MMRTDSPIYNASAQSIKNMTIMSEGSLIKRRGMRFKARLSGITQDTSKVFQSRLVRFVFSDDEQYIISIENAQVRCFRLLTSSVSLVSTLTLDTNSSALPFDDDYLHQYTFSQYGDVMFICHPLFMPRMLIRTSLTSFVITPYTFDVRADNNQIYQPYASFHPHSVTLDPSASTGTGITLTTSAAYFDTTGTLTGSNYLSSLHVGVVIRYNDTEITITSVQSATQATGNIVGTLRQRLTIINPLRTTDTSTTVEVTHINHGFSGGESITVEGAAALGGITAAQINGVRTVGTVININTYTITAAAAATSSTDGGGLVKIVTHAPTDIWSEQAFSARRGYPAAVTFHESRLVFAGTIDQPDTIWFSQIGEYFNFDVATGADADSFEIVAATGDVNEIRYIVSSRDLQVFTDSSEFYIPAFLNQTITPTNAQIKKQTPYGSEFVPPHVFDGATLFIQTGGNVMREYLYTDAEDAYAAVGVSTVASHLLNSPIDMDICHGAFGEAESYAVVVNKNGFISLFGSNRAEKRAGWMKWESNLGYFGSVLGVDDRLFATVWSDGFLQLCEFAGSVGLDNYTSGAGPTISMTNIFANGTTVHIIGVSTTTGHQDYLGTQVVASGSVSVAAFSGYSTFHVGTPFDIQIKTNPIDADVPTGPMTGDIRSVSSVILDVRNCRSVSVNGRPLVTTDSITGKREFRLNGYGRDPQITITQAYPLPLQVNGLIAELII